MSISFEAYEAISLPPKTSLIKGIAVVAAAAKIASRDRPDKKVSAADICGPSMDRLFTTTRHRAMFLCHKWPVYAGRKTTLLDLARLFGGRRPSAVMHGIRKIEEIFNDRTHPEHLELVSFIGAVKKSLGLAGAKEEPQTKPDLPASIAAAAARITESRVAKPLRQEPAIVSKPANTRFATRLASVLADSNMTDLDPLYEKVSIAYRARLGGDLSKDQFRRYVGGERLSPTLSRSVARDLHWQISVAVASVLGKNLADIGETHQPGIRAELRRQPGLTPA